MYFTPLFGNNFFLKKLAKALIVFKKGYFFAREFVLNAQMLRYFAEIAYKGSAFNGWQKQPHSLSIQETIEQKMSLLLGEPLEITGCGRTDTGVHASQYFFHFDWSGNFPKDFLRRLNQLLPPDIAVFRIFEVPAEAHARYDATHRAYTYYISLRKDPFGKDTRYFFPYYHRLNMDLLQEAAALLLQYQDFYPFCKSHTDVKTKRCDLRRAEWVLDETHHLLVFHIAADRFLRGMVRLIVGMCLSVAIGQMSIEEVREALEQQTRLRKSLSVPPDGLFLTEVLYLY